MWLQVVRLNAPKLKWNWRGADVVAGSVSKRTHTEMEHCCFNLSSWSITPTALKAKRTQNISMTLASNIICSRQMPSTGKKGQLVSSAIMESSEQDSAGGESLSTHHS